MAAVVQTPLETAPREAKGKTTEGARSHSPVAVPLSTGFVRRIHLANQRGGSKSAIALGPPQGRGSWRLQVVAQSASGLARSRGGRGAATGPRREAQRHRPCAWALPVEKPPSLSPKPAPRQANWQSSTVYRQSLFRFRERAGSRSPCAWSWLRIGASKQPTYRLLAVKKPCDRRGAHIWMA